MQFCVSLNWLKCVFHVKDFDARVGLLTMGIAVVFLWQGQLPQLWSLGFGLRIDSLIQSDFQMRIRHWLIWFRRLGLPIWCDQCWISSLTVGVAKPGLLACGYCLEQGATFSRWKIALAILCNSCNSVLSMSGVLKEAQQWPESWLFGLYRGLD